MVSQFYRSISDQHTITDQEMSSAMQLLSTQHAEEFDTVAALKELYIYVAKYRDQVCCLMLMVAILY